MIDEIWVWVCGVYSWMRMHDLPNWIGIIFTVFLWPLVLSLIVFWWNNHKVNRIPHLRVSLASANIKIGGTPHVAIDIVFTNNTDTVVFLNRVKIKKWSKDLPSISTDTSVSRDIRDRLNILGPKYRSVPP
jgi:hypothetical protein